MAKKPSYTSVIANRGFRFLWINQILIQLAYNTLNFSLIIWVFKLVDSTLAVSALMLSIYLPVILFGLFAGVFVDRTDRRKIILVVDLLLAVCFFLFIFIKGSYPLILINTFIINSLAQFFLPSESSSIPILVPKKQLFLANSLFALTLYGSFMVGYSAGGPILNHLGINPMFILGSITLLIAFSMAWRLPRIVSKHVKSAFTSSASVLDHMNQMIKITVSEAQDTYGFIKGKLPVTISMILLSAVQGGVGMLAVVMPAYLERVLKIHATDASYILMLPIGLGMILGAIVTGRIFHHRSRRSLVTPAILIGGFLVVLLGLIPSIADILQSAELSRYIPRPRYFFRAPSLSTIFALIAFLMGFCAVSIIVPCQTVLQEHTTKQNRGKIFATLNVAMTAFSAVAALLAGALSDLFGAAAVFTSVGIIMFIFGLMAFKPHVFLQEKWLPVSIKEFLGSGHWED